VVARVAALHRNVPYSASFEAGGQRAPIPFASGAGSLDGAPAVCCVGSNRFGSSPIDDIHSGQPTAVPGSGRSSSRPVAGLRQPVMLRAIRLAEVSQRIGQPRASKIVNRTSTLGASKHLVTMAPPGSFCSPDCVTASSRHAAWARS